MLFPPVLILILLTISQALAKCPTLPKAPEGFALSKVRAFFAFNSNLSTQFDVLFTPRRDAGAGHGNLVRNHARCGPAGNRKMQSGNDNARRRRISAADNDRAECKVGELNWWKARRPCWWQEWSVSAANKPISGLLRSHAIANLIDWSGSWSHQS